MTLYVIVSSDGYYVAPSRSKHSYTSKLQNARIFPSREVAQLEKCENERISTVEDEMRVNQ